MDPSAVPVAPGLFEVHDGQVVLLGHRCHVCDTPGFPRRTTCGTCATEAPDETTFGASGGTLFGWTQVAVAPPGYQGRVPFWFGIVDLDDGLRVLGRLVIADDATPAFGTPVVCVTDEVDRTDGGEPVVVWAFAPAEADPS
jgi:uncharacterized OB-fold protein